MFPSPVGSRCEEGAPGIDIVGVLIPEQAPLIVIAAQATCLQTLSQKLPLFLKSLEQQKISKIVLLATANKANDDRIKVIAIERR